MVDDTQRETKNSGSIWGVLFFVFLLWLLIDWLDVADRNIQTIQLAVLIVALIVGVAGLALALKTHAALQSMEGLMSKTLLEMNGHAARFQAIRDELHASQSEIAKIRTQQRRDAITLEAIVAEMPPDVEKRLEVE